METSRLTGLVQSAGSAGSQGMAGLRRRQELHEIGFEDPRELKFAARMGKKLAHRPRLEAKGLAELRARSLVERSRR